MTGFHADPAALEALASRLQDTAAEYRSAALSLEAPDDLGPISVALAGLTGEWSGRIRAAERDFATAAAGVRTAAKAYRATDAAAAEELDRTDG
ncbi:hypothetical protein AB0J40_44905 [Amycolatopsis sp. NPDC049691]|uniref:hypothetical protein n=1 Tax=Amycolatopsis sp. NPDC049691 TaxID=3155155 RepID=UPI00343B5B0F